MIVLRVTFISASPKTSYRKECMNASISLNIFFDRFAGKKSNQVIASFAEGDPFDSIDNNAFQRVWSNSCFQLKLSENFTKPAMVVELHNGR